MHLKINRKGGETYDYLIWGGLSLIVLWIILKSFGVIQSPQWMEMIPYAGGTFTMAGVSMQIGRFLERFDRLAKDMRGVENKVNAIDGKVNVIETEVRTIDRRLLKLEK